MATRPVAPIALAGGVARGRVMIVDDSVVVRAIVQRIIGDGERFEVVAQAASSAAALAALERTGVDIILLDIEMPGIDGITAIPELLARSDNAAILMLSSHCARNAELSVRAMTMGASETLLKPSPGEIAARFAEVLERAMMRIAPAGRRADDKPALAPAERAGAPVDMARRPIECLAIAASTGGPHALASLFAALPRDFAPPIVITQHLPDDFIPYFARQIAVMTGRPASVARDGDRIEAGAVLVAPGDAHLALCRIGGTPRVRLDRGRAESGCMPSADPMFATMAEVFGVGGVGVVLSGMGRDGTTGACAMAKAGAEMLAQDEASAVIWGMPGAVARRGLARRVAPPAVLADHIARRASLARWS